MVVAQESEKHRDTVSIVTVGPPDSLVGGMAHVARQINQMDFRQRYRVAPFDLTFSTGVRESWLGRVGRHFGGLYRLRNLVRDADARIVHIHTCSGFSFFRSLLDVAVANAMHARSVLHIHGAAFDKFFETSGPIGRRLIAIGLRSADAVIALSPSWKARLEAMAPGARLHVVENAVEGRAAVGSGSPDGCCRFLLLAKMDEWKGVDDLLDAAVQLRLAGTRFEIVLAGPAGSAGDAGVLAQKIAARELDRQVRYVGALLGEAKAEALAAADVYVQPSHHEGMPISVLEALASGLPIVATRVGAVPEVITDGQEGKLVQAHRPDQLAQAMRLLAEDVELRGKMSANGLALAAGRFSLARLRDDLVALYDDLLASSVRNPATSEPRASARADTECTTNLPLCARS